MRSFSFFCSRSVLAWYVATALVAFWIFAVMERWYSLKSLACCKMLLRYSCQQNTQTRLLLAGDAAMLPKRFLLVLLTWFYQLHSLHSSDFINKYKHCWKDCKNAKKLPVKGHTCLALKPVSLYWHRYHFKPRFICNCLCYLKPAQGIETQNDEDFFQICILRNWHYARISAN